MNNYQVVLLKKLDSYSHFYYGIIDINNDFLVQIKTTQKSYNISLPIRAKKYDENKKFTGFCIKELNFKISY
jgi:hypothetical protein